MNERRRWGMTILAGLMLGTILGICGGDGLHAQDLSMDIRLNRVEAGDELDRRYDDTWGGSIGLTYMFSDYVGVETAVNYLKWMPSGDDADLGIIDWTIDGVIAFPFLDRFRVYGFAGMGLYVWKIDRCWWISDGPEDGADLGINWGLGLDAHIWRDIDLSVSYRRHRVEFEDTDNRFCWSEISLGARFHFDPIIFRH
ncbi:porin family protein [bacterium]|nr:porin family protein [candidate division CSSED10-310 bacterium]